MCTKTICGIQWNGIILYVSLPMPLLLLPKTKSKNEVEDEKTTTNITRIVYLLLSFLSVFRPFHSCSTGAFFPLFLIFYAFFLHDAHWIFRLITYYACKTSAYFHLNELTLIQKKEECRHTYTDTRMYIYLYIPHIHTYPCTK